MKKYIKIFDEEQKRMRRFPLYAGLMVEVHLNKDCCRVRFVHAPTGLCPFYLDLVVEDKKMQAFCANLITCHLNDILEDYIRKVIDKDFQTFYVDEHKTWPLNKMAVSWAREFNGVLKLYYVLEGKKVEELVPVARKLYGE